MSHSYSTPPSSLLSYFSPLLSTISPLLPLPSVFPLHFLAILLSPCFPYIFPIHALMSPLHDHTSYISFPSLSPSTFASLITPPSLNLATLFHLLSLRPFSRYSGIPSLLIYFYHLLYFPFINISSTSRLYPPPVSFRNSILFSALSRLIFSLFSSSITRYSGVLYSTRSVHLRYFASNLSIAPLSCYPHTSVTCNRLYYPIEQPHFSPHVSFESPLSQSPHLPHCHHHPFFLSLVPLTAHFFFCPSNICR